MKRISGELERRYSKHHGKLLPVFTWLLQKSVRFLGILHHRRLFYVTHEVTKKEPYYIRFHDPDAVHQLFRDLQTKLQSHEGTALAGKETFDCAVCYDHKPAMAAILFPECKHFFCRGCISEDLSMKVREGQLKDLTCLGKFRFHRES